ncbi:hypothetical protein RI054_44g152490 [Pseudoscourfieldia marina]
MLVATLMYDDPPDDETEHTLEGYGMKYDMAMLDAKLTSCRRSLDRARDMLNACPPQHDESVVERYDEPRSVVYTCHGSPHPQRLNAAVHTWLTCDGPLNAENENAENEK